MKHVNRFSNKDSRSVTDIFCSSAATHLLMQHNNRCGGVSRQTPASVPAHFEEEPVSFGHAIQLMLVLFQEVNVTFFRNKFQELKRNMTDVSRAFLFI